MLYVSYEEKKDYERGRPVKDPILAALLSALNIFVAERVKPAHLVAFAPIPEFCQKLEWCMTSAERAVLNLDRSIFLAHFLEEAEEHWRRTSSGVLRSGPWVESDDTDAEFLLEASAVSLLEHKFLVVELLGTDLSQRRKLLQSVREKALQERRLRELVERRTREIALTQEAAIDGLASLSEMRDYETGGHIKRTQTYVRILAQRLSTHPKFKSFLNDETIEMLYKSAQLHDIGKVGLPDRILLKRGKLTEDEFKDANQHPRLGREALVAAERMLGGNSFLRLAKEIAYTHHEKWDGSGYPEGLRGEAIPIPGRLMAVADVYDALTSQRVYKAAFPHEKAVEIIVDGRGTHFDPDVVDAFLELKDEFELIAITFADRDEDTQCS